jgi:hypothetical protein
MAKTFRFTAYTAHDLGDPTTAETLWEVLDTPLISPARFDSVERAKRDFDAHQSAAASDIYGTEGVLFVRGAKNSFTAMFLTSPQKIARWTIWWSIAGMIGKRSEYVDWIFDLSHRLPAFFAFGCSSDEYEAKHLVVEESQHGSVTREPGVATSDFLKHLPGLYWLNIFGPELTQHFGDALFTLPHTNAIRIGGDQAAVLIDEPIVPVDLDERCRLETEMATALGGEYFYSKNRADNYEQVPTLRDALQKL